MRMRSQFLGRMHPPKLELNLRAVFFDQSGQGWQDHFKIWKMRLPPNIPHDYFILAGFRLPGSGKVPYGIIQVIWKYFNIWVEGAQEIRQLFRGCSYQVCFARRQ